MHLPARSPLFRVAPLIACAVTRGLGLRGHIALVCNVLRLTAASQPPSQYLPSLLLSHQQWQDFQPRLKQDTMQQAVYGIDALMSSSALSRPPPHVGPLSAVDTNDATGRQNRSRPRPTDIELGSVCTSPTRETNPVPMATMWHGEGTRNPRPFVRPPSCSHPSSSVVRIFFSQTRLRSALRTARCCQRSGRS